MGAANESPSQLARLDESDAVVSTRYPRRLQCGDNATMTSLPLAFCRELGLTEQGQPLDIRRTKGTEPVVIEEEAIVIRPHPGGQVDGGE